jgi:hypothetical protein
MECNETSTYRGVLCCKVVHGGLMRPVRLGLEVKAYQVHYLQYTPLQVFHMRGKMTSMLGSERSSSVIEELINIASKLQRGFR